MSPPIKASTQTQIKLIGEGTKEIKPDSFQVSRLWTTVVNGVIGVRITTVRLVKARMREVERNIVVSSEDFIVLS